MEIKVLFDGFGIKENWDAAILFQHFRNLLLLFFIFCNDAWPSNPLNIDHIALFSQFEHCWVKHRS
jgi:hypothetical protein